MKLITKSIDCQKYEYTTVQRRTDIDLSNNTTILLFSQDITIRQILTRNIKIKSLLKLRSDCDIFILHSGSYPLNPHSYFEKTYFPIYYQHVCPKYPFPQTNNTLASRYSHE